MLPKLQQQVLQAGMGDGVQRPEGFVLKSKASCNS
jgi:hypothetical protein